MAVDRGDHRLEEIGAAQDGGAELLAVGDEPLLPLADGLGVRIIKGMVVPRSPPAENAWVPAPVSSTTQMLGCPARSLNAIAPFSRVR